MVQVVTRWEKLVRWIESHPPVRAWVNLAGDGVTVHSEWIDLGTGTLSVSHATIKTLEEARHLLGY